MTRSVSVHFPERVWAGVVDFEPYLGDLALAPGVRQRLRDAVEMRQESPIPTVFRVAALTHEEADVLENWLSTLCARTGAPRECQTALDLVREGQRRRA